MKIKIEVDLTPAELRALIGLPDVAGLQEDMIEFLRERISHGVEGFDPTGFVRENIQSSRAWKRLMSIAKGDEAEAGSTQAKSSGTKRSTSRKSTTRKSSGSSSKS